MADLVGIPVSKRRTRPCAICCFVVLAIVAVLTTIGTSGSAQPADHSAPTGPAAQAILHWFKTDRSLGCFDRQEKDSGCTLGDRDARFDVHYGDATGGGPQADALAIVLYQPDMTGNSVVFSLAYFHREGTNYRFVRTFPHVNGTGLVEGTTVQFLPGKAKFSLVVSRPNDPLCCATGRASFTITLNPAPSTR